MSDWIFLDLDGCLLRSDKSVSPFTEAVLLAVQRQGHRLAVATARPPRSVRRLLPESLHDLWWICGNGTLITHNRHLVEQVTLDTELVLNLVDGLRSRFPSARYAYEAGDAFWTNTDFSDFLPSDPFTVVEGLRTPPAPVNKVLVTVDPGVNAAELLSSLPRGLSVALTDGATLVQIMPAGVDKGSAIERLVASHPGVESLCFGDDLVDVPMFRACSWPVALENSVAVLKDLARDTTGHHDEDGVAHYLAARYLTNLWFHEYDHAAPDFVTLTEALDRELWAKKGEAQGAYHGFNRLDGIVDVVVVYLAGRPVGCASFKHRAEGVAEVKRVFVDPSVRGLGLARRLMDALEARALRQGLKALVLETDVSFAEANGLYTALGYVRIPNFPPYEGMETSVCYQRELTP